MHRSFRSSVLVPIAFALIACGGTQTAHNQTLRNGGRGDSERAPSLDCLPDMNGNVESMGQSMQRGFDLARAAFEMQAPPLPEARDARSITFWSEEDLQPWLARKTQLVSAARAELDRAAEEGQRQRIIGGALVGLLYEDVARVLVRIPIPTDLDNDPEIRDLFEQNVRGEARPFVQTSARAYRACGFNARAIPELTQFTTFCRERRSALPDSDAEQNGTSVEILAD